MVSAGVAASLLLGAAAVGIGFNQQHDRQLTFVAFALLALCPAIILWRTRRRSWRGLAIGMVVCWAVLAPLLWMADFQTS
jgi:hypothetical protein